MTKFLSQALKTSELEFRQAIQRLERSNGRPSHDIRLTTEVHGLTRQKISDLGLNGNDTTPEELYHAIMHRVAQDDQKLVRRLRYDAAVSVSADAEVVDGMVVNLNRLDDHKTVFAIKAGAFKKIIRSIPPKKTVKSLGYRSIDSFIKRESIDSMLAAAWMLEGKNWRNQLLLKYKSLTPKDFESRDLIISAPRSNRWKTIASNEVAKRRNNLVSLKEIGAIVLLPLGNDFPDGAVTASMTLALHEMNMIRAGSSYLKLVQFRSDFGKIVASLAEDEIELRGADLSRPNSWALVQRYYHKFGDQIADDLYDMQIKSNDFAWHSVERSLAKIEPSFEYWVGSAHLGLIEQGKAVSLNLIDASINYCNKLDFANRTNHYFSQSLWNELLLRYLKRDKVEQTILKELQPKLVAEEVTL